MRRYATSQGHRTATRGWHLQDYIHPASLVRLAWCGLEQPILIGWTCTHPWTCVSSHIKAHGEPTTGITDITILRVCPC